MPKVLNFKFFSDNKKIQQKVAQSLKQGAIIIYPTDTVYGIGCNLRFAKSVVKIAKAKKRDISQPFSFIVPSKKWIRQHVYIPKPAKFYLKKMPGPYTLILRVKNNIKIFLSKNSIGVRMPKHPFCDWIRKNKILLITTSVNISGQAPSNSIKKMPLELKKIAKFIIDDGQLVGKPSKIIDCSGGKLKRIRL